MFIEKAKQVLKTLLVTSVVLVTLPNTALANGETSTNLLQLQKDITKDMTNRETVFTAYYTGDETSLLSNLNKVVKQAVKSDDYLDLSWTNIQYNVQKNSGTTNITFNAGYRTSKEQEDFVDQKVAQLVPTLITSEMSEFDKEKAIHDWVIANVSFDSSLQQRTAYTALTTGKTVCAGYAMLMKKMLNAAGINCVIVTGSIPQGEHAWNKVQIGGTWYNVDSTNDDGFADQYRRYNKTDAFMTENHYTWDKNAFPKDATQN